MDGKGVVLGGAACLSKFVSSKDFIQHAVPQITSHRRKLEKRHLSDDTDFTNAEVDPTDDAGAEKAKPVEKELQNDLLQFPLPPDPEVNILGSQ